MYICRIKPKNKEKMAQHYIYDDKYKNRVKMVLNDEEYARYNKLGCGSKLILAIIVIFVKNINILGFTIFKVNIRIPRTS